MEWGKFYATFGEIPLLTPQMIYPWVEEEASQQVQLSRWVKQGKLIKLAQGKYIFSRVYRKSALSSIYIANQLLYPSYVSLEYALSYYGLIPEAVFSVTSVTTRRPVTRITPIGSFAYRHVKRELFWGYRTEKEGDFETLMALPEKAILDLFYFWRGEVGEERIKEMRFQNLSQLNRERLLEFTEKMGSLKLERIVQRYLMPFLKREGGTR